ncbi:hypothetical protein PFICI_13859 [Pestalotiopsis fici W106-1]|uniref:Uncharacterized protein n=1 Tax=Pestalotiopsis fici (strain W106-1 / CGMCC3.15140) TaxID=1229662 RepID=W3WJD6_PESFW|nr:uncharacterized protein PFICI_13859 [Pestalotiopsis fici W106-1]ETS73993.1 hypothetical protein PFICI_13859 [Pestalotiopsis fici W106-1]
MITNTALRINAGNLSQQRQAKPNASENHGQVVLVAASGELIADITIDGWYETQNDHGPPLKLAVASVPSRQDQQANGNVACPREAHERIREQLGLGCCGSGKFDLGEELLRPQQALYTN